VLIFAQKPDPPSIHLSDEQIFTITARFCRFMMHEFISPKGKYHPHQGHMADNAALCDWAGESQDKLHIVHKHFKHYQGV
jgi:hypothetical protein